VAHFFSEHKKKLTIAGVLAVVILFFFYLYAFSRPGEWHNDAFLYRLEDGLSKTFRGSDAFADYEMHITREEGFTTQISFKVNDTVKSYKLLYSPISSSPNWNIEIVESGALVFKGETISIDPVMLMDENKKLDMHFSVSTTSDFFEMPTTDELFPTNAKLVDWTINGTHGIRGNTTLLIMMFILSLFLALDLAFPRLFFFLEHGLDVTGGEPSDFFLFGQKVGRILLLIGILVCVVLSLTTH